MMTKKLSPHEEPKSTKTVKPASKPLSTSQGSECCSGNSSCSTSATQTSTLKPTTPHTTSPYANDVKKGSKTRIVVKYDVGFNNHITIRGKGANLSWEKGIPLKNVKNDEWVWETETPFTTCEFKVLINDKHYEVGDNHLLASGASIQFTPKF